MASAQNTPHYASLHLDGREYSYVDLQQVADAQRLRELPYSIKILLENLLRHAPDGHVDSQQIAAVRDWSPQDSTQAQINFTPARVVLQDFTGVPAVVDLAAMRDAMAALGGDPQRINPLRPVDLVIDHSVMVDHYASSDALQRNTDLEFERNRERYQFLRWGQNAFANFRVVPPGTGIVHQVNLEYLASVVVVEEDAQGRMQLFPDTLVGTDSHTTMINGLGVLGWGVGGIEAEAAMLGQPVSMLLPKVVGFRLHGHLREGVTATDLVLTVTQMLRQHGVVGCFVEFCGDGLAALPLADRATIGNMSPEYGATCAIFPIDEETLRYLTLSGRDSDQIAIVEAYAKAQGLWREPGVEAQYSSILELDLATVEPSLAGPKRPQDRVAMADLGRSFADLMQHERHDSQEQARLSGEGGQTAVDAAVPGSAPCRMDGQEFLLEDGHVVIAAITSCTNTSNPDVMLAAGLVAQKAHARGLRVPPWVKTSLAPGSQVVPAYLEKAGVLSPLEALGFHIVGFGCTTCIGNSGPLREEIQDAIAQGDILAASVLSGNRNFEGRIHQEVRANYLASPPLVVAYALAGRVTIDLSSEALATDADGKPVYLADIWPTRQEISDAVARVVSAQLYRDQYADVFRGTAAWQSLATPEGQRYDWPESSYVRNPPYFVGLSPEITPPQSIRDAYCLVKVGDSITTDHISPAGAIPGASAAGRYLQEQGVAVRDFNSYGSRRGNHEVMMRGTFANIRLRNELIPDRLGGWTRHIPSGESCFIYDAAQRYAAEGHPLVVLAGKEYGSGSSRDWAAKGTNLLGIRAVIAESYERIHRSNLVGFAVLPLQFCEGESAQSLGLTGEERFTIPELSQQPQRVEVRAQRPDGSVLTFTALVRIDTASEWQYYRNGGILHTVLRSLAGSSASA
ncbi:MAG: aconitate hydratase AcnA [Planctomycetota bacterium]|nr:MAG: aconitate hydratase AcnA [Planctomycetota bacterium]